MEKIKFMVQQMAGNTSTQRLSVLWGNVVGEAQLREKLGAGFRCSGKIIKRSTTEAKQYNLELKLKLSNCKE